MPLGRPGSRWRDQMVKDSATLGVGEAENRLWFKVGSTSAAF